MPSNAVKLIECPRDAWQGLKRQIPTELKVQYLRGLIDGGFRHIDAVSFVSPKAVPQMADSEQVLAQLFTGSGKLSACPTDQEHGVEIIGIVVNEKGAERAIATGAVSTIGYPCSISETFLRKNQNQSREENRNVLQTIKARADAAKIDMVVYISMAFGNPYGDRWDAQELSKAVKRIVDLGVHAISLADTVGIASPELISEIVSGVTTDHRESEIGVHLHSTPADARAKVLAAYDAGCRRFDSAIGGLGGCPFAQDSLVGNIPTEAVIDALQKRGVDLPMSKSFGNIIAMNADIGSRFA
ncbi:MAG TPA: hydroxymethylglutaryl-CoA lyase [Chthoniobacterales bacterium]|jgi:hydroxymethylglutaryl-CoA lyase